MVQLKTRCYMTKEIDRLIELLKAGEPIPEIYKQILFPINNKEYELTYENKIRKEDLLADADGTFAVPLQLDKVHNAKASEDNWSNIVVFGDNLQFLKTCYANNDELIRDKVKGKVKLIYIDPPFASENDFEGDKGQKAYSDKVKGTEFIEFLRRRLILAKEILSDDGSIYVHLDEKKSHYIKVIMDELGFVFQREIVWRIGWVSGYKTKAKNWIRNHDIILFYTKSKDFTFNKEYIPYPKDYKRRDGKKPEGDGYAIEDTWNCSNLDVMNSIQIMSFSEEKTGYPTQKNENLLKRIIESATNEGDLVMDFFAGSGTTAAVAEQLNRRWIVCDIGKLAYFTIQKRILQLIDSNSDNDTNKHFPFITCTLGSYNLEKTLTLPYEEYQKFVAELFKLELIDFKINGLQFEGKFKGNPVKIFNFEKYKDSVVDETYIDDMHSILNNKYSGRIYIVAPANQIDFLSDYVEKNNIRYYFLKIPYQVIKELHNRKFQKIRQPRSIKDVNNIEESVGFHFIRMPDVVSKIVKENNLYKLKVIKFTCNETEYVKNDEETKFSNFENLSSIFIDKNYNGKEFKFTDFYFIEDLNVNNEEAEIDLGLLVKNQKIMIVYTDIYGNDFSEIYEIKE